MPLAYVNLVGGQDELVFDGDSLVVDASGVVLARVQQFVPAIVWAEPSAQTLQTHQRHRRLGDIEEVYRALVCGLGDYVRKNGFTSVVIGLSGGIDSALTAAIAVDALGPAAVFGVGMPSRHRSQHSRDDAADLAHRTGLHVPGGAHRTDGRGFPGQARPRPVWPRRTCRLGSAGRR